MANTHKGPYLVRHATALASRVARAVTTLERRLSANAETAGLASGLGGLRETFDTLVKALQQKDQSIALTSKVRRNGTSPVLTEGDRVKLREATHAQYACDYNIDPTQSLVFKEVRGERFQKRLRLQAANGQFVLAMPKDVEVEIA